MNDVRQAAERLRKTLRTGKTFVVGNQYEYDVMVVASAYLREHDIIQEQFHATDDALCKIGDLALQVSDHFNGDGSLKGDGKWRLNEIAKCCWAIVEAEKPVAAAHTKAREKSSLRSQLAEAELAELRKQKDHQ